MAIIGDIAHSRVARSNLYLLSRYGAEIVLCGPASLLPRELAQIAPGVILTTNMDEAIRDADVIMMLRVQLERQHEAAFPASEYFQFYGLRLEHLRLAKPDVIVMHPGPINRGREISSEVADSQRSVILNQVENGIAVRMAVLEQVSIGTRTMPRLLIKNGHVIDPASGRDGIADVWIEDGVIGGVGGIFRPPGPRFSTPGDSSSRPASSICTCICASPASSTPRPSRAAPARPPPGDSRPSVRCPTPRR